MFIRNLIVPAALCAGAFAALTPAQVVTNINIVTTESQGIVNALTPITTSSPPTAVENAAQTVTNHFNNIINDLTGDVSAMDGTVFDSTQSPPVCAALTTFVQVHQKVLSLVFGTHSIAAQFGVTAPIAAALRSLEGAIDGFAFGAIAMLPGCASQIQQQKSGLDTSVQKSISAYDEICIPSPLYPIVLPVCV